MTWTYVGDLSTDLDTVRFLLGDTDTNNQLFTDAEINAILLVQPNTYLAAALLARSLAAKYAGDTNVTLGDYTGGDAQLSQQYEALANRLESQGYKSVSPYIGGIDSDQYPKQFKRGQFDNTCRY